MAKYLENIYVDPIQLPLLMGFGLRTRHVGVGLPGILN